MKQLSSSTGVAIVDFFFTWLTPSIIWQHHLHRTEVSKASEHIAATQYRGVTSARQQCSDSTCLIIQSHTKLIQPGWHVWSKHRQQDCVRSWILCGRAYVTLALSMSGQPDFYISFLLLPGNQSTSWVKPAVQQPYQLITPQPAAPTHPPPTPAQPCTIAPPTKSYNTFSLRSRGTWC